MSIICAPLKRLQLELCTSDNPWVAGKLQPQCPPSTLPIPKRTQTYKRTQTAPANNKNRLVRCKSTTSLSSSWEFHFSNPNIHPSVVEHTSKSLTTLPAIIPLPNDGEAPRFLSRCNESFRVIQRHVFEIKSGIHHRKYKNGSDCLWASLSLFLIFFGVGIYHPQNVRIGSLYLHIFILYGCLFVDSAFFSLCDCPLCVWFFSSVFASWILYLYISLCFLQDAGACSKIQL